MISDHDTSDNEGGGCRARGGASAGDAPERSPARYGLLRHSLHRVVEATSTLTASTRELASHELRERTERAGDEIYQLGRALRLTSQQLDQNIAAPYVEVIGTRVENMGRTVQRTTPDQVVSRLVAFASARPFWFSGAALLLGLSGGRVLKNALAVIPVHPPVAAGAPAWEGASDAP